MSTPRDAHGARDATPKDAIRVSPTTAPPATFAMARSGSAR